MAAASGASGMAAARWRGVRERGPGRLQGQGAPASSPHPSAACVQERGLKGDGEGACGTREVNEQGDEQVPDLGVLVT